MTQPRTLRPVPDPLGCYLRPGRNDHKVLLQMLVDGINIGTGLVADPVLRGRQADLMSEARRLGVETVLDPRTVDLSTPGGVSRSGVTDLPWAGQALHTPQLLTGPAGRMLIDQIATMVKRDGYSAVLAPTHAIDGLSDPWVGVDHNLTCMLRAELNSLGLGDVLIYYPLVTRSAALLSTESRVRAVATLSGLPIDAVWLRLHPFGTATAGPLALRRYLEICRALHELGLPLVAEHSGTVGVALLAFGAVGGIESGITFGERVDLTTMLRPPKPDAKPFAPSPRVYLHAIGGFVDVDAAAGLFETRGMKTLHVCANTRCCPRGWLDMRLEPRRHFVGHRAREVAHLSGMPESLRPGQYLENFLRPASDRTVRTAEVAPKLIPVRRRLDSWRGTLGAELARHSSFTSSAPAAGKRQRRSA
jgi:hypothetical protein